MTVSNRLLRRADAKGAVKSGTAGLCLAAALCAVVPGFAHADAESDALRAQIEALRAEQARIADMQRRTDETLRSLEAKLGASTAAGSTAAPASPAATPAVAANQSGASKLKISGDVRLRGQGDYGDNDLANRNSAQIRARFGATYSVNDRVTLGARLVTGDDDDPNSTDVQLSNFDNDLKVSLDLAYAQLNLGDLKLYGGKLPQPFTRTDLVWDGDVNPQGLAATYKHGFSDGSAFRANALGFIIDEQAVARDSTMWGAQLGYDSADLGAWKFDVSAAYYNYQIGSLRAATSSDWRNNLLTPDGLNYLSDFNLGDVIVGATWKGVNDRWPLRIVGDYVHNFGAAHNANTGYGVDFIAGRASQPGDWRITYGYSMAEVDAVFGAFSHDNISIGSNYRLHSLTAEYTPMAKTIIGAIWYHYRPEDARYSGANDASDWLERVRLYFLVNF